VPGAAVAGAVAPPPAPVPPEVAGCAVAGAVAAVVAAAPVGAGGPTWAVAGRFAQPASNTPVISSDAIVTCAQRLSGMSLSLL
jgi:hypothetical protein